MVRDVITIHIRFPYFIPFRARPEKTKCGQGNIRLWLLLSSFIACLAGHCLPTLVPVSSAGRDYPDRNSFSPISNASYSKQRAWRLRVEISLGRLLPRASSDRARQEQYRSRCKPSPTPRRRGAGFLRLIRRDASSIGTTRSPPVLYPLSRRDFRASDNREPCLPATTPNLFPRIASDSPAPVPPRLFEFVSS